MTAKKDPLRHNFQFKTFMEDGSHYVRVICSCGVTSPSYDTVAEEQTMANWCNHHSGMGGGRGVLADTLIRVDKQIPETTETVATSKTRWIEERGGVGHWASRWELLRYSDRAQAVAPEKSGPLPVSEEERDG